MTDGVPRSAGDPTMVYDQLRRRVLFCRGQYQIIKADGATEILT